MSPAAIVIVLGTVISALVGLAGARAARSWLETRPAPAVHATHVGDGTSTVHVTMYTTKWCGVCKRAKTWMAQQNYSYDEVDVEASVENARAFRKINARGGVPTFDIDGEIVKGFDPTAVEAAMTRAEQKPTAL